MTSIETNNDFVKIISLNENQSIHITYKLNTKINKYEGYYLSFDPEKILEPPNKTQNKYDNLNSIIIPVINGLIPKKIYQVIKNLAVKELNFFHLYNPELWKFLFMYHKNSEMRKFSIIVEKISKKNYQIRLTDMNNEFLGSEDVTMLKFFLENKFQNTSKEFFSSDIVEPISYRKMLSFTTQEPHASYLIKKLNENTLSNEKKTEVVILLKDKINTLINVGIIDNVCQTFCEILQKKEMQNC